jgi:hypothetical protein
MRNPTPFALLRGDQCAVRLTSLYNATSGSNRQRVFYKTATGSEGSKVTVTIGTNSFYAAIAIRISGANQTPQVASAVSANSSTPNPPSITPAGFSASPWGAYLIIAVSGLKGGNPGATVSSYPTDFVIDNLSSPTPFNSIAIATRRSIGPVAVDPGAFSWSASGVNIANSIVVAPS